MPTLPLPAAVDAALANGPHGLGAPSAAGRAPEEVARDFEAILVAQMIGAMRRTVPEGGVVEASASRRLLDGAFDYELAKAVLRGTDLGIAQQLAAAIARQAGATGGAGPTASTGAERTVAPEAATVPSAEAGRPAGARAPELVRPVDGRVTSGFGVRRDPLTGTTGFHAGVDFAVPRGTPIRAVADGIVVFSGRRGRGGNVVEVEHAGGLASSYAHAERTLVAPGQKVVAGEVLGRTGSTGRTTGPHLHFTVTRDGQPVDPMELLSEVADVDEQL